MRSTLKDYGIVASLIVGLLVAACGSGTEEGGPIAAAPTAVPSSSAPVPTAAPTNTQVPVPTGQLRYAGGTFFLYGTLPGTSYARSYLDAMFDVNLGMSVDGHLTGETGFITQWQASPDSKAWTVKTRDGVVFHNGDEATAEDLKFSLDYYNHSGGGPGAATPVRVANVASVQALDGNTVVTTLKSTDIFFPFKYLTQQSLGTSGSYLVPKAYMESQGVSLAAEKLDFSKATKVPVGSGPYRFESDIVNQEIVVEAVDRPHWLYGTPRFRSGKVLSIPESGTRVALLQTGSVEMAAIPLASIDAIRKAGFDVVSREPSAIAWVSLQEQWKESYPGYGKNPLADVRVRHALSLAVDRQLTVEKFLLGQGTPAISSLHPRDFGYKPAPVPSQDVAKAKGLLVDAGYSNGFRLTLYEFQTSPEDAQIAEAIAVWWEQIGVQVNRKTVESSGTYVGIVSKGFSEPTAGAIWVGPRSSITTASPAGIKTVVTRVTEDNELNQAWKDIAAATTLNEYIARVQKYYDLDLQKWTTVNLYVASAGGTFGVQKGLGAESWKLGRGDLGNSINLNQLLTGKNIVR